MSTHRFAVTDVVTGRVLADTVPLHVQSITANLGGVGQPGTLSGVLDLGVLPPAQQAPLLEVLEPRRSMLWAIQDDTPIWAGILWDWPHSSAASNQLPIKADEIGSLFGKRQVRDNLNFAVTDPFTMVEDLLNYALGKPNGAVANLVVGVQASGSTGSIQFSALNLPKVLDAVNQVCAQFQVEYAFVPGWGPDGETPTVTLQLGHPHLVRPYADTMLQFVYPTGDVLDYAFPRMGSSSVNSLLATASNAGSVPWQSGAGHGQNSADLAAGFPLLEESIAYNAAVLTAQPQIDAYADGKLPSLAGCTTVPEVTVGAGGWPRAGQVRLGDEAYLVATSPLHPKDPVSGAPGLEQLVRIIGWTVTPSDGSQVESTKFLLGGVTT